MSQRTFTHRTLILALACGAATAAMGIGPVGCKQDRRPAPAASQESLMPTARMEALIAADSVISEGEKMKMEADRTGDAALRARGESHVAQGRRMHAEAARMR